MTLQRVADRPTWLLSRANARAQALLQSAFAAEGVRGYDFRVLAALEQYGAASQADVGRNTGIDRSDIVGSVDALVGRGYVRRDPDPRDGRRNVVTLTRSGAAALRRLDAVLSGVQDAVLEPLTASERATLRRLLGKLAPAEHQQGTEHP